MSSKPSLGSQVSLPFLLLFAEKNLDPELTASLFQLLVSICACVCV